MTNTCDFKFRAGVCVVPDTATAGALVKYGTIVCPIYNFLCRWPNWRLWAILILRAQQIVSLQIQLEFYWKFWERNYSEIEIRLEPLHPRRHYQPQRFLDGKRLGNQRFQLERFVDLDVIEGFASSQSNGASRIFENGIILGHSINLFRGQVAINDYVTGKCDWIESRIFRGV